MKTNTTLTVGSKSKTEWPHVRLIGFSSFDTKSDLNAERERPNKSHVTLSVGGATPPDPVAPIGRMAVTLATVIGCRSVLSWLPFKSNSQGGHAVTPSRLARHFCVCVWPKYLVIMSNVFTTNKKKKNHY